MQTPWIQIDPNERVLVYPDGSHCQMGSGWAAVVVLPDATEVIRSGVAALPTPAAAEIRAVLEGVLLAVRLIGHGNLTVFCDSSEAIRIIDGSLEHAVSSVESRYAEHIRGAMAACGECRIIPIYGATKKQQPHVRYHNLAHARAYDCARSANKLELRRLVHGNERPAKRRVGPHFSST